MDFKFLLLWSFVLLGRPQDFLIFLQPIRPALLLAVITISSIIISSHRNRFSDVFVLTETKRYLVFYAIAIVGIPFSYNKGIAFQDVFQKYLPNILFFLTLVSQVNTLMRLKKLVWIICLSTFIYSYIGYRYGTTSYGRMEIFGAMFDPNDVAYVLLSMFPICIFFLIYRESIFKTLFVITTIVISVIVVLLTGSRGGLLGLGVAIALMVFTKLVDSNRIHKVIFLLSLSILFLFISENLNIERYATLMDISSDYNMYDEEGRMQIWSRALDLIAKNPILGVGVNCFPTAIAFDRQQLGLQMRYQSIHNSYLQVATEMGILGFILFILMIFQAFSTFIRVSKMKVDSIAEHEVRRLSSLILIAFIGSLFAAFFLTQAYSIFFTLFFALGAIISRIQSNFQSTGVTLESKKREFAHDVRVR